MTSWTKKTFPLNTGATIPAIGLGTWQSKPNEVRGAVCAALKHGYRHIDTAFGYGNEAEVGQGIVDSGVPRSEIFLTSKLDCNWHKRVAEGIDASLKNLGEGGGGYLDLFLVHWPASLVPGQQKAFDDWDYIDTWKEMEKLPATGKVRAIGVSNFDIPTLTRLFDSKPKIIPAANQIELHPCYPSPKLVKFNQDHGIHVTAYSCLGSTDSPLPNNKTLQEVAKKHGKSIQQVLLVWGLKRGTSVIPKSVTESRIVANFDLDGLDLSDEDMKALDSIPDRFKVCEDSWLPIRVFKGDDGN